MSSSSMSRPPTVATVGYAFEVAGFFAAGFLAAVFEPVAVLAGVDDFAGVASKGPPPQRRASAAMAAPRPAARGRILGICWSCLMARCWMLAGLPGAEPHRSSTPKLAREFNFRRRKEADAGRYQRGLSAAIGLSPRRWDRRPPGPEWSWPPARRIRPFREPRRPAGPPAPGLGPRPARPP